MRCHLVGRRRDSKGKFSIPWRNV